MDRRFVFFALAALALAAGCGGSIAQRAPAPFVPNAPPARAQALPGSPYHHIVIAIQENRSFDNLFAGAAQAAASPYNLAYPVDVATSGPTTQCANPDKISTCSRVTLQPLGYESGVDPQHLRAWMLRECNPRIPAPPPVAGTSPCRMNGFYNDQVSGGSGSGALTYTYLPPEEIAPYVTLANAYGLADELFSAARAPSYPGHVFLMAGLGPANDPNTGTWGCANPSVKVQLFAAWTNLARNVSQCLRTISLPQALDEHKISWKYYNTLPQQYPANSFDGLSVGPSAFAPVWNSPGRDRLVARDQFFADVQSARGQCTLPSVSWVTPNGDASDHGGWETNADGPYWIATIYEAIANSPCYNDTAFLVVWDDSGGWYDHVPPPYVLVKPPAGFPGFRDNVAGFRVPLLFIAGNAVRGASHRRRDFGAILRFVEKNFGLGPLGGEDLDFRQDALQDLYLPHPKATISPIPYSQIMARARKPYSVKWFSSQPVTPADNE